MTNDEINCIVKFIEDCTKAGLITIHLQDVDKCEVADKFSDIIYGADGIIKYSERQELSNKIYLIFNQL